MQNDIQLQLEQIKGIWETITTVPEDLTPHGYPGLTKQSITNALGGLCEMAAFLATIDDYEPGPISRSIILPHLTNIRAYVTTHMPPSPIPHIPGFLPIIDAIQSILSRWLNEAGRSGNQQNVTTAMAEQLAIATSQIKDANVLYGNIQQHHETLTQLINQANSDSSNASQAKAAIDTLLNKSQISATQLEESASNITTYEETTKELTSSFVNLKDELEQNVITQGKLFQEFENYRQQVSGILGDSSRAGMAGSFLTRKTELKSPIKLWERVFVGSLVCLILMAVFLISPSLSEHRWDDLLFRMPLTAPIIWLGWFSAKQYGYNIRLSEDYAYKAASAMAFEGFKRESLDESLDMRASLLKTAIKNFGENPIRIYDGKGNHASPVQELFEQITEDKKVMELLKAIVDKFPSK